MYGYNPLGMHNHIGFQNIKKVEIWLRNRHFKNVVHDFWPQTVDNSLNLNLDFDVYTDFDLDLYSDLGIDLDLDPGLVIDICLASDLWPLALADTQTQHTH